MAPLQQETLLSWVMLVMQTLEEVGAPVSQQVSLLPLHPMLRENVQILCRGHLSAVPPSCGVVVGMFVQTLMT